MTESMIDQKPKTSDKRRHIQCAVAAISLLFAVACGPSHVPVAASKCSEVASHARKLLGARADSQSKTVATCKAASDEERGCAMAADSAADLMRCSM